MRKLLPIILALLGLLIGGGAGLFLRPEQETTEIKEPAPEPEALVDYVKMNNQFVVPIVENGRVASLVVMSLSLEVSPDNSEEVFRREPKLRDAFLQVMFDHANSGGFQGVFTNGSNLEVLRRALRETGKGIMGDIIHDVLISEMARQDS